MPQVKRKRSILQKTGLVKRQHVENVNSSDPKPGGASSKRTKARRGDTHTGGSSGAAAAAATATATTTRNVDILHGKARSSSSTHGSWQCRSVIDRQSAEAVDRLLRAAETRSGGATIKSLTLAPHVVHKKPTFAVTCQTLKYLSLLKQLLAVTDVFEQSPMLTPAVAYVLSYEVLFGQGLRDKGPAERAVLRCRDTMAAELERLKLEAEVQDAEDLLQQQQQQQQQDGQPRQHQAQPVPHPRWLRVNTLKLSVEEALSQLKAHSSTAAVQRDALLPDVLRLPPGTDLHDHPMVTSGQIILQSKASCLPAHALAPAAGWTVLDACAAPGNKTTHAAALVGRGGRVLAFDKDRKRLARLVDNAKRAGAGSIIRAECADFLSLDPEEARFAEVRGIILDPSCSGSGTAVSRMDHLLPPPATAGGGGGGDGAGGGAGDEGGSQRVEQLAKFQEAALRHALRFPALRRLAYSTCSVHRRENEDVVAAALPEALAAGFDLADPFPGDTWRRRGLPGSLPSGREAAVVRTDPQLDGTDGFFVAVFERRGGQPGGSEDGSGGDSGSGGDGGGGGRRGSGGAGGGARGVPQGGGEAAGAGEGGKQRRTSGVGGMSGADAKKKSKKKSKQHK